MKINYDKLPIGLLLKFLPGPSRKRLASLYHYRISHRAADPKASGCVMTWEVEGGREPYQIALERQENGKLAWHCTCADMAFHGESGPQYQCKHLQGLRETLPSDN